MSIRKHINDLKVHEKTVRRAIKRDLSPDLNPLDYAIWGILENKTKMQLSIHILVRLRLIEKKKMVAILSKFTVLLFIF